MKIKTRSRHWKDETKNKTKTTTTTKDEGHRANDRRTKDLRERLGLGIRVKG